MVKVGVNPEILKNREHRNLLNYNYNLYKSIQFCNGNESENPFLISNFTKIKKKKSMDSLQNSIFS